MKARATVFALAMMTLCAFSSDPVAAATAGGGGTKVISFFSISIDGTEAFFSELVTLTSEVDTNSKRQEAGHHEHEAAGLVIMRRGLTSDATLSAWHELAAVGNVAAAKKNLTLSLYFDALTVGAAYMLQGAWPAKVEIASGANPTTGATETVTLACDRISRLAI
jgi:phage tail-like protein